jgi:group I intron endonuclease
MEQLTHKERLYQHIPLLQREDIQCGIYKITNKVTGDKYIGETKRPIEERLKEHLTQLRNNRHCNKYLQRSFNKYGEEAFRFSVITRCSESVTDTAEKFFIKKYNTFKGKGFNMTDGGSDGLHLEETKKKISYSMKGMFVGENNPMWGIKGEKHPNYGKTLSEETKKHISNSLKGVFTGEKHHNSRYVKGIHIETGEILVFSSSGEAERFGKEVGVRFDRGNISRCCNGKRKTHNGYKWGYITKEEYKTYIGIINKI